jgi:uncharacterized repeat protein (TIGR03803 family)
MKQFAKAAIFLIAAVCIGVACRPASAETIAIHHFNGSDGISPVGPMVADGAGNLYGVTFYGGLSHWGVVYELSPPAIRGGKWTETVLHSFSGGFDGAAPSGGLTLDRAGNVYGSTYDGGDCLYSCGTIFELAPPAQRGGAWAFSTLHRFGGVDSGDGGQPNGNLIFDQAGNIYGTTALGGVSPGEYGVVFELSPPVSPGGQWTEIVLDAFRGLPDGAYPYGGLAVDPNGNLYGTTSEGGTGDCRNEGKIGCGTAYRLKLSGGVWKESIIYNFRHAEPYPASDMIFDSAGRLYGAASFMVFRLQPPARGGLWSESQLYQFPYLTQIGSDLIIDRNGNLYGTTRASGLQGFGSIYELSPPRSDSGAWMLTTLQKYYGGGDAQMPSGGLVFGRHGELFGATAFRSQSNAGYAIKIVP